MGGLRTSIRRVSPSALVGERFGVESPYDAYTFTMPSSGGSPWGNLDLGNPAKWGCVHDSITECYVVVEVSSSRYTPLGSPVSDVVTVSGQIFNGTLLSNTLPSAGTLTLTLTRGAHSPICKVWDNTTNAWTTLPGAL